MTNFQTAQKPPILLIMPRSDPANPVIKKLKKMGNAKGDALGLYDPALQAKHKGLLSKLFS